MTGTIRVFRYLEDLDAFVVTDEYREIADSLGLTEWHPAVWIGRLFCMDNDFGEHWFDNWELREQLGLSEDHRSSIPIASKTGAMALATRASFARGFGPKRCEPSSCRSTCYSRRRATSIAKNVIG